MSIFVCERCSAEPSPEWLRIDRLGTTLCLLCDFVVNHEAPEWEISIDERIAERINRNQPEQATLV